MKILLFFPETDTPNKAGSYGYYNIRAPLLKLGHEIIDFEFWGETKRLGRAGMHEKLKAMIEKEKPEVFFHGLVEDELDREFADYVRDRTASTSLILFSDDDWRFDHSVQYAGHYDFALTTCEEAYREFRRRGCDGVILTQWGCNPDMYYPVEEKKRYDVTFVGQPYRGRPELVTFLKEEGVNIRVWGSGWEQFPQLRDIAHGFLPHHKIIDVFGASRIVLAMAWCSADGKTPQIKGRTFEYAACRAFQLTNYDKRIGNFFRAGEEIVFYHGREDLAEKIEYYLEHEQEREKIAEAGYRRALQDHTWEKRFDHIFEEMIRRRRPGKLELSCRCQRAGEAPDIQLAGRRPRVSIISYVYNYGNYLKELIPSVLDQSFKDLEFLILDDGSTDNTGEVVSGFLGDRRLRYVRQENIGKDNRFDELIRRSLDLTCGELVNFVGGDDVFMPNKIERQAREFTHDPSVDIVFSDLYFIDGRGGVIPGDFKCKASTTFNRLTLPRTLFGVNLIAHPTVLMKRDCIDRMGGFEQWYCGDFHFWLKSAPFLNFRFVDEKLIKYRVHEKGASTGSSGVDITVSETNRMLRKMRSQYTILDLYPEILFCRDKGPALYSAYIDLGNAHMMAKVPQPLLAAIEYQRALEHKPKGMEAINNIGIAFFMLGDREKCAEFFRYLREHGGDIEGIRHNIGLMEQAAAGRECTLNFILLNELAPNNEFVAARHIVEHQPLPVSLFNMETTERSTRKKEQEKKMVYKEAEGLSAQGRHGEAARALEGLLDLYPGDSMIFNDIGVLYYYAGEVGSAVGCIERSIRIDPENIEARRNLANIYLETGRTDKAMSVYEEIMKDDPDDMEVLFTLGDLCREAGRTDEAAAFYGRVLKLEPGNGRAQESMARINGGGIVH